MSETTIVVVGAPGEESCPRRARAVSVLYLAAIDCLVVDLSTGLRLTVPAGVLEAFAAAPPQALRDVVVGEGGRDLSLPAPGPRVALEDLLAGIFGSPEWMAGHAVRARNLRAGELRRLTRTLLADRACSGPA